MILLATHAIVPGLGFWMLRSEHMWKVTCSPKPGKLDLLQQLKVYNFLLSAVRECLSLVVKQEDTIVMKMFVSLANHAGRG